MVWILAFADTTSNEQNTRDHGESGHLRCLSAVCFETVFKPFPTRNAEKISSNPPELQIALDSIDPSTLRWP